MNAALLNAGRDVGGAPPAAPQMGAEGGGGGTSSPVFQMGTQMLDAFEQDPSPENEAALTAVMMKAANLLQGMQQPQGQPAPEGMPPTGGMPMGQAPAIGG